MKCEDDRVPVTLLTGFLGAGKTTLLNHMIRDPDAANGPRSLDAQFEAEHQVAMADLLVVTKADLVTVSELDGFKARLQGINGTARLVLGDHGRIYPGVLFNLTAMRENVTSDELSDWLGASSPEPDPLAGFSGLAPKAPAAVLFPALGEYARHDSRIGSASIEVAEPIAADVFDFWLDTLIALKGSDILRMKGIAHVQGLEWPFVFHGVQHILDAPVPLKSWSGKDTTSRIVGIARDIDKSDLKAGLETLRMRPEQARADAGKTVR